jgi:hypothetical protein
MKNDKALSLLRKYFELPEGRPLPDDLLLSKIEDAFGVLNFTFWLEKKIGFELSEDVANKIILSNVRKYLKIMKELENGKYNGKN